VKEGGCGREGGRETNIYICMGYLRGGGGKSEAARENAQVYSVLLSQFHCLDDQTMYDAHLYSFVAPPVAVTRLHRYCRGGVRRGGGGGGGGKQLSCRHGEGLCTS